MSGKNLEFEIYFSDKARKQLRDLDPTVQKRVKETVKKLKVFPPAIAVSKIKTRPGELRIRVGNWRVFFRYEYSLQQVEIIAIRPREQAYN